MWLASRIIHRLCVILPLVQHWRIAYTAVQTGPTAPHQGKIAKKLREVRIRTNEYKVAELKTDLLRQNEQVKIQSADG